MTERLAMIRPGGGKGASVCADYAIPSPSCSVATREANAYYLFVLLGTYMAFPIPDLGMISIAGDQMPVLKAGLL